MNPIPNSSRLNTDDCLVLIVDIQQAFQGHISTLEHMIHRSAILIQAAGLLDLPILVTQQYPKGLGSTVPQLQPLLQGAPHFDKVTFSCCGDDPFRQALLQTKRTQILIAGIETHVCIAQTAFDLIDMERTVYLAVDAVASRRPQDHEVALRRMQNAGAIMTTTEAAIMEMTRSSRHEHFKAISKLLKELGPE